jgi:hypothetical protein
MANQSRRNDVTYGVASLLIVATMLSYSLLPSLARPIPPIFALILLAGAVLSLLSAIVAGLKGSRFWFLATLLPIMFVLMLLNFEQSTEVILKGDSETTTFEFSGSGKLTELVVFSPEYIEAAESPHDPKFAMWCIQPADHESWGEPVWRIRAIRYGVVPKGYVQCHPLQGKPESLRDSRTPYLLSVTTANAPGTGGYFTLENGKPQWAKNPPEGPCFVMENGKYKRIQCLHPAPCQSDSQRKDAGSC